MFILWAILVLVAAALLVIASLGLSVSRSASTGRTLSREKTVAAIYQDRLVELRAESAGGQAEREDWSTLEAELAAALLADSQAPIDEPGAGTSNAETHRPGWMIGLVSATFLISATLLVYSIVGDPASMALAGAEVVLQIDAAEDRDSLSSWREQLIRRVDRRPDDGKSWYLLGHVDLKLSQFASAAEAFAMAHEVHGDDPSIDVFWLQARYMAANGALDSTTRVIADRVLVANPNQPLVLELYAIDAYRRGAFQESVSLLNRALSGTLEAGHRQALDQGFQEARQQLGDLPASIDVEINVSQAPRNTTLFVIARPVGGGMPFAVVRRPADRFPQTVRLDDAVSMNPAAPLSTAPEIEVVVRLSLSGTAMSHPGDWQWQSAPLSLAELTRPLTLTATVTPPG